LKFRVYSLVIQTTSHFEALSHRPVIQIASPYTTTLQNTETSLLTRRCERARYAYIHDDIAFATPPTNANQVQTLFCAGSRALRNDP